MRLSTFQTVSPRVAEGVQVVHAFGLPRRVALYAKDAAVVIAKSPGGCGLGSDAFPAATSNFIPFETFSIITLPPGEALYARGTGAEGESRLSLAVSYPIPRDLYVAPGFFPGAPRQGLFSTPELPRDRRVPIVLPGPYPQRVVLLVEATGVVRVSFFSPTSPNVLISGADAQEFVCDAPAAAPRIFTFVKAPEQTLYAQSLPYALGPQPDGQPAPNIIHVTHVSVHATDIPPGELRGTTGIRGPDGQE